MKPLSTAETGIKLQKSFKPSIGIEIKKHRYLFLLLLPAAAWYVIFCYIPMYGNIIAFKQFNFRLGILGSQWVGFAHFRMIFSDPDFMHVFKNQVIISLGMLLINFPIPVVMALMLNAMRHNRLKRFYQTVYTFPHFISWVVVAGVFFNLLSSEGIINQIMYVFGLQGQNILMDSSTFRLFLYLGNAWKEAGWGTIIYLAALTGIDPELYNASSIDGANYRQQLLHITWPGISATVAIMLVLAVGNIMNTGFEQIINLYNASVMDTADIIDTYVYRTSIQQGQDFSYTAAIGLFKSLINMVLLLMVNFSVKVMGEEGIF